jgi:hypothetical protein
MASVNENLKPFRWAGPGSIEVVVAGRVSIFYPGDVVSDDAVLGELGVQRIALLLSKGSAIAWPPPAGTVLDPNEFRYVEMPRTEEEREEERAFAQASRDRTSSTIADAVENGRRMRALEAAL